MGCTDSVTAFLLGPGGSQIIQSCQVHFLGDSVNVLLYYNPFGEGVVFSKLFYMPCNSA